MATRNRSSRERRAARIAAYRRPENFLRRMQAEADRRLEAMLTEQREVSVLTSADILREESFFFSRDSLSAREVDALARQNKPVITDERNNPILYR